MEGRKHDELPISAVELSLRATVCLESAGVTTIGQLRERSAHDLLSIRDFGESTLQEVRQKLAAHGLNLVNDHWGYSGLWRRLDEALAVLESGGDVAVNAPRHHAIGFLYRALIKYDPDRGELLPSDAG